MEFEKGIHDPKSCSYPNKSRPRKQSGCKRHAVLIDFKDLRRVNNILFCLRVFKLQYKLHVTPKLCLQGKWRVKKMAEELIC